MDSLNQILFDDKSFSDLLKEIHGNQKKKAKQLASLIAELRPLVQSLGDATVVVPLIKEYMEIFRFLHILFQHIHYITFYIIF